MFIVLAGSRVRTPVGVQRLIRSVVRFAFDERGSSTVLLL